jgi:hypothetical protein
MAMYVMSATQSWFGPSKSGDLRFVFLQEISCMEIVVKGASFILADPNNG